MSAPPTRPDPVRRHRRQVRYQIVLPVLLSILALVAFAVVLVVGVAAGALVSKQITVIMGVVFTAFIAFPMTLICLLPYGLAALGAVGAGKLYAMGTRPFRAVRRMTANVALKTDELAPKVAAPFAAFNAWVTRWEYTLRHMQQPATDEPPALPEK